MRKFSALILTLSLVLAATACSSSQETNSGTKAAKNQSAPGAEEVMQESVSLEGDITGEIQVSCYDSTIYKNYLEEAAKAFEEKYAGTKVNISTFSAVPDVKSSTTADGKSMKMITKNKDTKSESDYISQINTELMTGGGADVLGMDILPCYKYAENGQIEDLNAYMEADETFAKEDYRQNILNAATYKGGQYIFPMDYTFDILSYDKTLLDSAGQGSLDPQGAYTYEQLIEIGQNSFEEKNNANPESPVKMFNYSGGSLGKGTMFGQLFHQNYDKFIDVENKTVDFTGGQFADILKTAKDYEEKGYMDKQVQKNPEDVLKQNSSQNYLYKTISNTMLLPAFNDDRTTRKQTRMTGNGGMFTENDEIAGMIKNNENDITFDISQAYALNSNSGNKRTAWEFIKFLAGEEMQTSLNLMGTPVNIKAGEEKAKQEITGELYDPENNRGTTELNEKQTEILNNYITALNRYSDMLTTYRVHDTVIDDMVYEEAGYFFDGSKSAEEVADVLQGKIELYLKE